MDKQALQNLVDWLTNELATGDRLRMYNENIGAIERLLDSQFEGSRDHYEHSDASLLLHAMMDQEVSEDELQLLDGFLAHAAIGDEALRDLEQIKLTELARSDS